MGICVKSVEGAVSFQNKLCKKICGDQVGKKCKTGCMLHYLEKPFDRMFGKGMHLLKNVNANNNFVDVIMINDEKNLTSLLYKKTDDIHAQLNYLEQFNLSKMETKIIEKFLQGYSSKTISHQMFISPKTLRTHLNNIYKKIPLGDKQKIISAHLGS
jgi:DNA-binding CsgD family transcriptional regulator